MAVPLLVLSLAILILEGPPILFCQQRVGRAGRLFTIYKLRTMGKNAGQGSSISVAGDSRITPLGRWFRRFKLDELPQLWNVLRGDMSLVGPRPDVPGYLDGLKGEAAGLLRLRPGVTGPATLAFRDEEELLANAKDPQAFNDKFIFPEKVRLNLEYMKCISFKGDLRYILRTIFPSEKTNNSARGTPPPSLLKLSNGEARRRVAARED